MGSCVSCVSESDSDSQMKKFCSSLGCCFAADDDKSQSGEPTERTTLLGNPVSNNYNRPIYSSGDFSVEVPTNQLGDEQSTLNRILQQTACDIIDVSAIPAHLERKEYMDRVKLYQQRLPNLQVQVPLAKDPGFLLKDLSHPERTLGELPLLLADLRMVSESFDCVCQALQEFRVQPQEELVVQFGAS